MLCKSGEFRGQSRLETEIWKSLANRRFSKPRLLNEINKRTDIETKITLSWGTQNTAKKRFPVVSKKPSEEITSKRREYLIISKWYWGIKKKIWELLDLAILGWWLLINTSVVDWKAWKPNFRGYTRESKWAKRREKVNTENSPEEHCMKKSREMGRQLEKWD